MSNNSYYINEKDEFVIEEYNQKKPFSSFLPAVSGLYGKPMWAYYVNRGQCMATFGVNNKDYSIMEFQPANKAYRQTALQGFRTFLKVKKADGTEVFYEPFRDMQADKTQNVHQKMRITSYDFKIEDINETLGIKTEVMFCTLPNECIPGLIRQVNITNISREPVFDTFLMKKVSQAALGAVCGTFINFTDARYTIYFLVWEQIFFILAMGTICLDVQNPNASCRASVSSVLV